MGQHTYAVRKVLKARSDQHQVRAGGGGAPTLDNATYLTAPDGLPTRNGGNGADFAHAPMGGTGQPSGMGPPRRPGNVFGSPGPDGS